MKFRTLTSLLVASSLMIAGLASTSVFADDGQRLVRSVSSPPGLEEDPEPEGEHAFITLMNFRVPTQEPTEIWSPSSITISMMS